MAPHHHGAVLGALRAHGPALAAVPGLADVNAAAVTASLVHTLGYLAVTVVLAVVVYEKVGLGILRRAWINLNVVWSVSLIVAAAAAVLT
jgi:hypothetical protein